MKVKINRQQLVKPEMNTLNVMLGTLNLVSSPVNAREEAESDQVKWILCLVG